ncbi:Trypsin domain containing protein [Asbolus verrucosus]|uniref:Trypsin domain containing protein n=1 Tax=Asbolus verrucosus TaxID=1661398 RepID=A0A482VC16_ASBVE|nr:Trypsin domain containing protein [Asbolus verrucosus]
MRTILQILILFLISTTVQLRISLRVVGGRTAAPDQFPFVASLRNSLNECFCGASIIEEKWILTAAHCVRGLSAGDFRVVVGTHVLSTGGVVHRIANIVTHPDFEVNNLKNDVALIHLYSAVRFDSFTQPIKLGEVSVNRSCTLIGWGEANFGLYPDELQFVTLKMLPFEECQRRLEGLESLEKTQICTSTQKGEGICFADSGGPLISQGRLIGIVSYGTPSNALEPYICEICAYSTCFFVNFKKHAESVHQIVRNITTESCSEENEEEEITQNKKHCLIKHKRKEDTKRLSCNQCRFRTTSQSILDFHTQQKHAVSTGVEVFQCQLCLYKAESSLFLTMHVTAEHDAPKREAGPAPDATVADFLPQQSSEDDDECLRCAQCSFKTKWKQNLRKHLKIKHMTMAPENVKWVKCDHCPYKTKWELVLLRHMNIKHGDPEEIEWFKCKQCAYRTKWKSTLKIHVTIRHTVSENINWLDCKKCSYKAKTRNYLRNHVIAKHVPFNCEQCSYKTVGKTNLKAHLAAQHN